MQAPRLIIDGPFGAPAQEHAKFKKVVLIGMGTGIAPMLSIMRDTLHRLAAQPKDLEVCSSQQNHVTAKCPPIVKTPCFIYSAALLDVLCCSSWRGAWYGQPKA
jgi:Na+-transporting NADH:ubiquinone oxidoreductase subunit NqrF